MVLDFFDKAYLINLDRRKDRLAASTAILDGLGIPFERFPAINIGNEAPFFSNLHNIWVTCSFGLYGCGLSHHAVLTAARDQNLSNVLIMEDDILPCDGFVEKAKECLSELRGKDWGLFYFYQDNPREEPIYVGKHIAMLPKAAWRTHCYAVNGPAFAPLIKMIEDGVHFDGPNCWWDHIDDMYVTYSSELGVVSYGSIQTLVRQMGDEGTGTKGDSDADMVWPSAHDAPVSNPKVLKGTRYATARNWDKPETIHWYENDRFTGGPERGGGVYSESPTEAVLKWDNWQSSVCLPANDGFYCKDHELFVSATPMEVIAVFGDDDDSKIKDFCERAQIDYPSLAGFMIEDSAPRRQEMGSVYPIEGQILYALVRVLRPETVLEFGTMYGCSTEHIVAALERNDFGRLLSVDINPQTSLKSPRLEIIKGDGMEFAEKWNEPVGMVFEDGPHSFHFTYSVLSKLLPNLTEKGCFVVHDIDFPFMSIGFQTQYQVRGGFLAATKSFYPLSLTPPPGRQPQGLGYFSKALGSGVE